MDCIYNKKKINDEKNNIAFYLHEIRNIKVLTDQNLQTISEFKNNDILIILKTYNNVISYFNEVLDRS
jgi:hypothetical protein